MAGVLNDSEEQRFLYRIRCITYREMRDEMIARTGNSFITRKWISEKLRRDETWVQRNWNKTTEECYTQFGGGRPQKLSQESKDIVASSSGVRSSSYRKVAREILEKTRQRVSYETVRRERYRQGLKPFHVIAKPLKTNTHVEDRKWLADFVADWTEEDFLHIAPSDEFYVYVIRKPNHQNDRIWAKNIEDISNDERYREMVQDTKCIGIFVMFTAKKLLWILKEQGQSWDGVYFREIILQQHVIPFLRDPNNVLDTNEVTFLHDKAPCMKANATQHLLEDEDVKFWGNSIWPGNSPDMNPAENLGAIIKDKVEELMANEDRQNRYSYHALKINIENTLKDLEDDTDLFIDLLCSMRKRFDALKAARGGHTTF
jgi:transposase